MKALTIHQPYPWLILATDEELAAHGLIPKDRKTVENRSWPTKHRGPLAIHASANTKLVDKQGLRAQPTPDFVFGAIVGVVDVVDCVPLALAVQYGWATGPYCWLLANPRQLSTPIYTRGFQRIWNLDLDVDVLEDLLLPAGIGAVDLENNVANGNSNE